MGRWAAGSYVGDSSPAGMLAVACECIPRLVEADLQRGPSKARRTSREVVERHQR